MLTFSSALSASLVVLLLAAAGSSASASAPASELRVVLSSGTASPGDVVTLFVTSFLAFNASDPRNTTWSPGPIVIDAVTSAGTNYTPLAGVYDLRNTTFVRSWTVGSEFIDYVSITVRDLETGLFETVRLSIAPSWSWAWSQWERQRQRDENTTAAALAQVRADEDFRTELGLGIAFALFVALLILFDHKNAHKARLYSRLDRFVHWLRFTPSPIPDPETTTLARDSPVPDKAWEDRRKWVRNELGILAQETTDREDYRRQLEEEDHDLTLSIQRYREGIGLDPEWNPNEKRVTE